MTISFTAPFLPAWVCWLALIATPLHGQILALPPRPTDAPSGSELAARTASLPIADRENEVCAQILAGNVPEFLRRLCPVRITGASTSETNVIQLLVTADYLAAGSDTDYLFMPLSPAAAQRVADALECSLPTPKIVDEIYFAAEVKLPPAPIPPGPAMTTVPAFSNHNALVWAQRRTELERHPLGALVAGDKKDVVISSRLASATGKVAIYGWHRTNGTPIQPLYLGHTAAWVDYSHGIRLVSNQVLVNGEKSSLRSVLADPVLSTLLSAEGPLGNLRYPDAPASEAARPGSSNAPSPAATSAEIQWQTNALFKERTAILIRDAGVRIVLNAPAEDGFAAGKRPLVIFYALPNGNTIEQTIGRRLKPGDDWHYDIQHIGAQVRFLRQRLPDRFLVIVYLENDLKSWPAWRKRHGDQNIPEMVSSIRSLFAGPESELVLSGHSGGGSWIFGYLNAVSRIPPQVVRIAFLDSDYAYDRGAGHAGKLANWLKNGDEHFLCVLAYNDAVALLNGKHFVSVAGGTWGKSHEMERDLEKLWTFSSVTNGELQTFTALGGRVKFLLRENPEKKIWHTVQVERNGFIEGLLSGTPLENQGYEYLGERAYTQWIAPD